MGIEWLEGERRGTCPVCGDAGAKTAILRTPHFLPRLPDVTLIRCHSCGAAFLEDLTVPDYAHDMPEMVDYYVEQGAGIDLMTAPLLRVAGTAPKRCLEVGCGFGFALDFARHALGWDVTGVDPSMLAVAGSRMLGFPLLQTYLDRDTDLGGNTFEVVLCSEIIEHVADPHTLLAVIRERLSNDGVLFLTTPNLEIVRTDAPHGAVGRALSAGIHLILFTATALEHALRSAGFEGVLVEATEETLRAYASPSANGVAALARRDAAKEHATLLRYFDERAGAAPAASNLACGFAYRHFKECVNGGHYPDASASFDRLARIYRERFGIDVTEPASIDVRGRDPFPFNLTGTLFFRGILELNYFSRPDRAAACFAAAIHAGEAVQDGHVPFGLHDGETEGLVQQGGKHLPMALATSDPERAIAELGRLESREDFPPPLLREAREQTFIRLVNAGAYAQASRLEHAVRESIDPARLVASGEDPDGALDAPYCLGMLALQQGRHGEAAMLFGAVYRAGLKTPREHRAGLVWSARYHEALSLARIPDPAAAREALTELAASRVAGLPDVPDAIAAAARRMLASGGS